MLGLEPLRDNSFFSQRSPRLFFDLIFFLERCVQRYLSALRPQEECDRDDTIIASFNQPVVVDSQHLLIVFLVNLLLQYLRAFGCRIKGATTTQQNEGVY